MTIFTKMVKFYYSDKNNYTRHIHVALDSILSFIFEKLLKLPQNVLENFLLQNKMITLDFLQQNVTTKNAKYFSIEMSPDVVDKYNLSPYIHSSVVSERNDYYKIKCRSEHVINFIGNAQVLALGDFESKTYICENLRYLVVMHPAIYVSQYYLEDLQIWIVKLKDNQCLMLVESSWHREKKMFPIDLLFDLLLTCNLSDIINNSQRDYRKKWLILPLLDNISSSFSNIQVILDDIPMFKDLLFVDNSQNGKKCKNFHLENVSKLKVVVNNKNSLSKDEYLQIPDEEPFTQVRIQRPFLYLLFNEKLIFQSGGFFNIDSFIIDNYSTDNDEKRMKFHRF